MSDNPRDSHAAKEAKDSPLAAPAAKPAGESAPPGETKPVNQLTPEEQMALFEKELKETDWGHQPC